MNVRRLKYVASVMAGQSPSSDDVRDSGALPFLQGCGEFGEKYPSPSKFCEGPPKRARKDAWLISVRAPVGELNLADQDYGIGRGLAAITAKAIEKRFLGYLLIHCVPALSSVSTGSTYDAVSADQIGNLRIPVPDLETQKAIANFLDREITRIDQLIEKKQRMLVLLAEQKRSRATALVTRGLNPTVKMSPTKMDCLAEAPSHWRVRRIASLYAEADEMGHEGLPILSVSINWGISDRELGDEDRHRIVNHIQDKTSYKRVRPGDLVYNMMRAWQGAFGVTLIDGLVSPAYVVARPKENIHSSYFEPLLRTPMWIEEFRRASKGIADFRQRLYWEHFRQVRVVLPPWEEQIAIAQKVRASATEFEKLLIPIESSLDLLREFRSSLITAAVTGQIDVTTWGKRGIIDSRIEAIEEEAMP